jgi:D-alanine-D-alanine ligase
VKPTNRGGGLGIDGNSVVHTFEQLETKVNAVKTELGSDSMIEEYLPGREFSVAILRQEATNMFSAMPLELIAPADVNGVRILSGEIKSQDTERFVEVADANIKSIISDLALDVFHALGARDYGRIDIRLDDKGGAHFLEANLLPSLMDGYGNFPKACWLNKQISYDEMLLTIVRMAMPQNEIESKLEHSVFAVNY